MATAAEEKIRAIQERLQERREEQAQAYAEQRAKDLEAYTELLDQYGFGQLVRVDIDEGRYVPGLVTLAAFKLPEHKYAQRWKSMMKPAKDGTPGDVFAASDMLGAACRVYPDEDAYKALCAKFSFVETNAALAAVKAAEGKAADEGKG